MGRVLIALVCSARLAHAECPPTAVSSGDPALVRSLSERLAASGIATATTEGCPAVRVHVEQRGTEVHLEAMDASARLGQRQVRDVATAAAIVESWTRHEIEEGTLPELAPPPGDPVDALPAAIVAPRSPTGIGLAFESSVGDDASLWLGGAAAGCVALGPTCVGGAIRAARDTRSTGDTAGTDHRGTELAALATIDLPRRLGGFTISPGAGVGYGWLGVTTTHLDAHMVPFDQTDSSHALRGELHVSIVHPLAGRFALVGELRGDTAIVRTDLAGAPRTFARAAIGIRFGVP